MGDLVKRDECGHPVARTRPSSRKEVIVATAEGHRVHAGEEVERLPPALQEHDDLWAGELEDAKEWTISTDCQ